MNLGYLESSHVYRSDSDEIIAKLKLPHGGGTKECEIPLTAEQVVSAKIEPHGNFGRSKITITLTIQVEAQGTPEEHRDYFARCLLAKINQQRERLSKITEQLRETLEDKNKLEADLRAKAVVESALLATGQTK
ncbi:MAG: hypothetical protein WC708_00950 [Lentisphaeria bacterium]|jgi:hypothetical protein